VTRKSDVAGPPRAGAETRAVLDALRRIVRSLRTPGGASDGLSAAGLFVLRTLADGGTLSVNEIAARTHTHQSSASVVVKRLARAGLLRRSRPDGDRRRVELTLAPKGAAALRRTPRAPQEAIVAAVETLDADTRARLAASLASLVRAMGIDGGEAGMFFEDAPASAGFRRSRRARS